MSPKIKLFLALFIPLFLIDQYSKWYVFYPFMVDHISMIADTMPSFQEWLFGSDVLERQRFASVEITSFLNFVVVWNDGVSFGLFSGLGQYAPLLLSGLAFVVAGIFFGMYLKTKSNVQSILLICIISGALGNVWDRIRFGGVADFIDVYWGGWHYPAFNIADALISVGVILYAIHVLLIEKPE